MRDPLAHLFHCPLRGRAGTKISALVFARTFLEKGTTHTNEERSSLTEHLATPTAAIRKTRRNSLRTTQLAAPPYGLKCSPANRMVPEHPSQKNNYFKFS